MGSGYLGAYLQRASIMDAEQNMTVFQKLVSASYKLFSRQNGTQITNDSINELKNYINQVNKFELKLETVLNQPTTADSAPVTYMQIINDQVSFFRGE